MYAASFVPTSDESYYLASGCSAGLICLWDGSEKGGTKPLATFENAHDLGVTCLTFAPNLVTSKFAGIVKIKSQFLEALHAHELTANCY